MTGVRGWPGILSRADWGAKRLFYPLFIKDRHP